MLDLSGPFSSPFGDRRSKAAGAESRRQKRRHELLPGVLVQCGGAVALGCSICDHNEFGARVRIQPGTALDSELHLIHPRDGAAYWARVVWRFGNRAGLEFMARLDLTRPGPASVEVEAMRVHWLTVA
jgi:hypothetical protein